MPKINKRLRLGVWDAHGYKIRNLVPALSPTNCVHCPLENHEEEENTITPHYIANTSWASWDIAVFKAASAPEPSVGEGLVLGTLELEDVVVVVGLLDGTLLVVEEEVEVVVEVEVEVVVGVDDVVGVYVDVGVHVLVVVGASGVLLHVEDVEVGSESPEEPNTHEHSRTPTLVSAKY